MDFIDYNLCVAILAGAIRAGTPLIYAGLGELIYERSGVINLGLEGFMLVGAMTAVWAQVAWGNCFLSIFFAALCTAGFGVLHWLICVKYNANQIATGLAFVILCSGLTSFFGSDLVGKGIVVDLNVSIPVLSDLPFFGPVFFQHDLMVYIAVVLVFLTYFFLYYTRIGVMLRAAGESAHIADAAGVPVIRLRLLAAILCGILCGLSGAHLSLVYASQWQENMVAGRGWIALVLVIFAMWRPMLLMGGSFLFGGLTALNLNLQAAGVRISSYLLSMLPFIITIIVLVVTSLTLNRRKTGIPADLGKPYQPYR